MKKISEKKMKSKLSLRKIIIIIGILIIAGITFINWIFHFHLIDTKWEGGDALAFFGSIFSGIGTIILGYIAWKQNDRLLKVEENTFIASNSGSAVLTEVSLEGTKRVATNLFLHEEQIVYSEAAEKADKPMDYNSVQLTCKIESLDRSKHIAFVNVKRVLLIITGEQNNQVVMSLDNPSIQYSKVAISKDFDRFKITIILTKEEKQSFIETVDSMYSTIDIDLDLSFVTDNYVKTDLLCRAVLVEPNYSSDEGIYCDFRSSIEELPMCFWKGASLLRKDDIMIKNSSGGYTNGKDEDAE